MNVAASIANEIWNVSAKWTVTTDKQIQQKLSGKQPNNDQLSEAFPSTLTSLILLSPSVVPFLMYHFNTALSTPIPSTEKTTQKAT